MRVRLREGDKGCGAGGTIEESTLTAGKGDECRRVGGLGCDGVERCRAGSMVRLVASSSGRFDVTSGRISN